MRGPLSFSICPVDRIGHGECIGQPQVFNLTLAFSRHIQPRKRINEEMAEGITISYQHQCGSLSAQLTKTSRSMQQSISRLSSGLRVQSAADNAAGMAVAENMRAQQGGYKPSHAQRQ